MANIRKQLLSWEGSFGRKVKQSYIRFYLIFLIQLFALPGEREIRDFGGEKISLDSIKDMW